VGHIVTTYSESTTRCCVMLDHSGLERETTWKTGSLLAS
jgi:hypothetical protein